MNEDKMGRFVRVYMKNSHVFHGAIQSWSEDGEVVLKSPQGEVIVIPSVSEISAYVFIVKSDGAFLKEQATKDSKPVPEKPSKQSKKDRINSLVELHKLKAASEREMARSKLRSSNCTANPVEYDTVSVLRALTNNPRKQDLLSKRRDSE